MSDPTDPLPSSNPIEQAKLFNEFQSQGRARTEAGIKLIMVLAGGTLTLSVGAILGNSPSKIPPQLVGNLAWSWGLLFYSLAAGTLAMAGMIAATFHMGVRMRKRMQSETAPGVFFFATWSWLRILNAIFGLSALLSFLVGLVLISQVAIGVANTTTSKQTGATTSDSPVAVNGSREAINANNGTTVEQQSQGRPEPASPLVEAEKDRAAKAALDKKLVDFNGDLAHYTGNLVLLGALQIVGLVAQLILLVFAFKESRRASDIARDAMIAGQGAFVFAVSVGGLWEHDSNTNQYNWRLRALMRNTGKTPTKNLTMRIACMVVNHRLPKNFDFDSNMTAGIGNGLLGPKADAFTGFAPQAPEPALTPRDIIDAQNGQKFIYLMGWLRYRDVFPKTPEHLTRYCWLVTPSGDPMAFNPERPDGLTFLSVHHPEGNSTEDIWDA